MAELVTKGLIGGHLGTRGFYATEKLITTTVTTSTSTSTTTTSTSTSSTSSTSTTTGTTTTALNLVTKDYLANSVTSPDKAWVSERPPRDSFRRARKHAAFVAAFETESSIAIRSRMIESVTVKCLIKSVTSNNSVSIQVCTYEHWFPAIFTSNQPIQIFETLVSREWLTNPYTDSMWTWDEIDKLEASFTAVMYSNITCNKIALSVTYYG